MFLLVILVCIAQWSGWDNNNDDFLFFGGK